jgi:hypothetical protein
VYSLFGSLLDTTALFAGDYNLKQQKICPWLRSPMPGPMIEVKVKVLVPIGRPIGILPIVGLKKVKVKVKN